MDIHGEKLALLLSLGGELMLGEDNELLIQNFMKKYTNADYVVAAARSMHSMVPKVFLSESWIVEYNNFQFFKLYRMEKNTFQKFVEIVGRADEDRILSKRYSGGHHPVDSYGHALIFLWYMATQDTLLSIGTRFKVSPTTVMSIINKMLYFVCKVKAQFIKFPRSAEELAEVSSGFKNYPGVVGAIDGTHIFVRVEKDQQDSYIDRYRRHSINLMAICDAATLFAYIFVGFPGSAHDSRVFENSIFYKNIERHGTSFYFEDDRYHLIGDSAFALKNWLMTPYRGDNLTRIQKNHNFKLSSERVKIEHAFGGYKGRWGRVRFINTYNICKAIEIASAACVLHNFCLLNGDVWDEQYFEENNKKDQNNTRSSNMAKIKRDGIAMSLLNNLN